MILPPYVYFNSKEIDALYAEKEGWYSQTVKRTKKVLSKVE